MNIWKACTPLHKCKIQESRCATAPLACCRGRVLPVGASLPLGHCPTWAELHLGCRQAEHSCISSCCWHHQPVAGAECFQWVLHCLWAIAQHGQSCSWGTSKFSSQHSFISSFCWHHQPVAGAECCQWVLHCLWASAQLLGLQRGCRQAQHPAHELGQQMWCMQM